MGVYKQGFFGPYSGRVGNLIGTFWKGRCVLRIRAANYSDANTIAQQTQRLKFKIVSSFLKAHEQLIRLGFAAADASITAFNSALKTNLEAVTGDFPNLALDLTAVKLSTGNLPGLEAGTASSTVAETVKIDWNDNSNSTNAFVGDKLMVSVIDSSTGEVFLNGTDISRSAGTANIVLPSGWTGRNVEVHAFFVKKVDKVSSQDHVSASQYIGNVDVA